MVDNKPFHIELDGTITLIENINVDRLADPYKKLDFDDKKT